MHLVPFLLLAAGIAAFPHRGSDQEQRLVVETKYGPLGGTHFDDGVIAYLGIPYALPPTGDLRFLPPRAWNKSYSDDGKVLDMTHFGPTCFQFNYNTVTVPYSLPTTPESEDCLNLNVFVPERKKHKGRSQRPLPVYIWTYGGGFTEGGTSAPTYDPSGFVQEAGDIIVVTFNYRMNIFGFPNTPALGSNGQNLGIRDHRAVLEWVRDNIEAFGGDATRIIAGGHSSGADCWNALGYVYKDDPIFSALLLESGTVQVIGAIEEDADSEWRRVASATGCGDEDREKELSCMRGVDAVTLKNTISNKTLNTFASPPGGLPMVDNVTLFGLDEYVKWGNEGSFAQVPTLMGSTNKEGDSVLNFSPTKGVNNTLSDIMTTGLFTCNLALEVGFRAANNVPVWQYRYMPSWPIVNQYSWLGPYHGSEVPMVLGSYKHYENTTKKATPTEKQASRILQQAFAEFIRDPLTGPREWPRYDLNSNSLVKLFPNETLGIEYVNPSTYDAASVIVGFMKVEVVKAVGRSDLIGPLAAIFSLKTEEEVVELANDTEFGLAGYFYSQKIGRIMRVDRRLECGMVGVNTGLDRGPIWGYQGEWFWY